MKLTLKELQKLKLAALKARVLAYSQYEKMEGSRPRSEEETLALAVVTINRVKKAIREGRWLLKEGVRKIEYRAY